jgi:hypothetical protein
LGGKLKALACHPTKIVNKAEELTYLSTNMVPINVLGNTKTITSKDSFMGVYFKTFYRHNFVV